MKNSSVPTSEDSLFLLDGVINTDGAYCLDDNGMIISDNDVGAWRNSSAVEYIDENTKFNSNLIYDVTGDIVGICFTQI